MSTICNILKKGDDCKWYTIPENSQDTFTAKVEDIQNAIPFSYEWSVATDEFNEVFSDYMVM
jgi:hypothetical protein